MGCRGAAYLAGSCGAGAGSLAGYMRWEPQLPSIADADRILLAVFSRGARSVGKPCNLAINAAFASTCAAETTWMTSLRGDCGVERRGRGMEGGIGFIQLWSNEQDFKRAWAVDTFDAIQLDVARRGRA